MTTIEINTTTAFKGKYQVEVSDNTQLKGSGISKAKHVGDLNIYWATKKAIERLKTQFECKEISRW